MVKNEKVAFYNFVVKAYRYMVYHIWWRRKLVILERPMSGPSDDDQVKYGDILLQPLHGDDSSTIIKKYFAQKEKLFLSRLQNKNILGWGVFKGDQPIGYLWAATTSYFEPALRYTILVTNKEAYMFDGVVYPEFRKGKLAVYCNCCAWEELLQLGNTTAVALVNQENRRAMLFHHLLKYVERFQEVNAPLLFGKPLKATLKNYDENRLSRKSFLKKK